MTSETRRKVFEAADELLREGKRPTQQLIRDQIGSGSITTINRGLNEWWQALSDRLNGMDDSGTIPEPVMRLSSRLWSETLSYARQEHTKLRKEQEETLERLKSQLLTERSEYSNKLHSLNESLSSQQTMINHLQTEKQAIQKALHQAEEECYRLSKQENSRKNSNIPNDLSALYDQLLEERVKLRIKQDMIDELSIKNQRLIEENAELKLRLKQS